MRLLGGLEAAALDTEGYDALGLLALCGQDVESGDKPGQWRIVRGTAPDRVISLVDPESRHVHKTVHDYRDGYKAHVAVEPETCLIAAAALTPGNAAHGPACVELLAARVRAHTPEFINSYRRWRPKAERSIVWFTAHKQQANESGVANTGRLYGNSHPAPSALTRSHRLFGSAIDQTR